MLYLSDPEIVFNAQGTTRTRREQFRRHNDFIDPLEHP